MVRVCPVSQSDESSSFLKVNASKKQITIMDPATNQAASATSQKRPSTNQVPPKMFTFDAAFPPDASQVQCSSERYYDTSEVKIQTHDVN